MKLSNTITERACNIILTGIEPLEAVKQAIKEENKLISEMIEQRTERSQKALKNAMKIVYVAQILK